MYTWVIASSFVCSCKSPRYGGHDVLETELVYTEDNFVEILLILIFILNQVPKQKVNSKGRVLSRDCPIRKLPADVIQLVCEKLNIYSETGRDWRGLAGKTSKFSSN